jgi:RimJ/RimL family protein N-acetyltransferase
LSCADREDDVDPRTPALALRDVTEADLPTFFEHQQDEGAVSMIAFAVKDPADRAAFQERWAKILGDPAIIKKTILVDGRVAGHIMCFEHFGLPEVGYWLGRDYWGQGLATRALSAFLTQLKRRPLYARVAKDNLASLRVLEKCGFQITGEDKAFANARGAVVEEFILSLPQGGNP